MITEDSICIAKLCYQSHTFELSHTLQRSSSMARRLGQAPDEAESELSKRESVASAGFGWAHSVDSKRDLVRALARDNVPNLEADIVVSRRSGKAVMGHDADHASTLTFDAFWSRVMASAPPKNVKLDFKDEAAVRPCLARIARDRGTGALDHHTLWLNADLVPGPGYGLGARLPVDADAFLAASLGTVPEGVLSLGWKMSLLGSLLGGGYTDARCRAMRSLLERHGLLDTRLVLAVSARVVALNPGPLRSLVHSLPQAELLVWTGTGEPAVTPRFVQRLRRAFVGGAQHEPRHSGSSASIIDASRVHFDVKLPSGRSAVESRLVESLDAVWAARVQASYAWRQGRQGLLATAHQGDISGDGFPTVTFFAWAVVCAFLLRARCKRGLYLRRSLRHLPCALLDTSCCENAGEIV